MQVLCSVGWESGILRILLRLTNFRLGHACVPFSKMPPLGGGLSTPLTSLSSVISQLLRGLKGSPVLFIPTAPASALTRNWSHMLEGKSLNVMTLMVGIYLNQSRHHVGLLGPQGLVTLVIPAVTMGCGCEHQKGHGQMCWTGPFQGELTPCRGNVEFTRRLCSLRSIVQRDASAWLQCRYSILSLHRHLHNDKPQASGHHTCL